MNAALQIRTNWVRSGTLAGAARLVRELGGDPLALARTCQLDPEALELPDLPVDSAHVVAFFEGAAVETGCEDFGIRLASCQDLSVLGPLWMTMRSAQTVLDALQVLVQFFVVHTTGAVVGLERRADGSAFVSYATRVGSDDRQTIELGMALLCNELRTHCATAWQPRAVLLAHDRPASLASHLRCFGAGLSFNQERNALWLDASTLQTALSGGSRPTHETLRRVLVSRVDNAQAVAVKVEAAIRALMPFADCNREQVAQIASLSERTMQRRLAEAGTNFQALRDRVRADIALKYLRQSRLSAAQITEILGYSEPAAFSRAFRRQHGLTPSAARQAARGSPLDRA